MDISFWIVTTDFLGKVCLAVMALRVHEKIRLEKKIDKEVFMRMRKERVLGFWSIVLFVISYWLGFL